ncbi:hypothetical protein [Nocardia altamirensis]|uniref:hypothetical protein n=1 Tax=Nocardia altamirensis TaxID=472158 RepID=UPI0008400880|nr:hypothetical protein [Nocardia altamirensis]
MTLYVSERSITSDSTPEYASRTANREGVAWRLSWLPGRTLTLDQARAGMELDELLSDPDKVHDYAALAKADTCASRIGLIREQVVILLAKRMQSRLQSAATN